MYQATLDSFCCRAVPRAERTGYAVAYGCFRQGTADAFSNPEYDLSLARRGEWGLVLGAELAGIPDSRPGWPA